jgi:hypothetical protein
MTLYIEPPLTDGDLVRTAEEPAARFTVVAVYERKAWLRALDTGEELIVDQTDCERERVLH